jgi:hypothetical protein
MINQLQKVPQKQVFKQKVYLKDGGLIWATSDPLHSEVHLDIKASDTIITDSSKVNRAITFYTYNNYSDFIDHYELLIYEVKDSNNLIPLKLIEGEKLPQEIKWDIKKEKKISLLAGMKLEYILRVYDKDGNYDETNPRNIDIKRGNELYHEDDLLAKIFGTSNLKNRSIPIYGGRVRVYGEGISTDSILKISEHEVRVDKSGKFVYEKIKKAGIYEIPLTLMDSKGDIYEQSLNVDVKDEHLFLVGIADVTVGENSVSGNIKPLESDEHYDGDIFVDGRVAFYLKGKIKGKYLITAQMDTQESEIKDMFKNIQKKDPKSIFRHLDPDRYYYVYGDDSTSYKDTNSQGKMYIKVQWDKSKALWGNYNTGITGNEFANVNRSLYGAKLKYSSMNITKYGDNKSDLIVFGSEAQSASSHNEFEGTGGSLYYLKHTDILQGSEKVWVEILETNSQRVAQKIELRRGRDYEIDELQGRIILTRPLSPYASMSGPSIIKLQPLDGDRVLLKVDYEYVPNNFEPNRGTYGVRGKQWLSDFIGVGATYAHEGRDGNDYEIKGVDVTLKGGKKTYIKAEYASSESIQAAAGNFVSHDGGLNFNSFDNNNTNKDGNAFGVEAKIALSDYINTQHDSTLGVWYKKRESGFSSARLGDTKESTDIGVEVDSQISENIRVTARGTSFEKNSNEKNVASLEADYIYNQLELGLQTTYVENRYSDNSNAKGTLVGAKAKYKFNDDIDAYISAQTTIDKSGSYESNDLVTIGASVQRGKIKANAEASTGDRGNAVSVGADYAYSDTNSIYGTYTIHTDRTDAQRNIATIGQKTKINDDLSIFTEHQFSNSEDIAGVGHTFGMDYIFGEYLTGNLTYTKSDMKKGNLRDRDAISGSLNYSKDRLRASTKLEYRDDSGKDIKTKQYLSANKLSYKVNPSWRALAKLNYSVTKDDLSNLNDAKFIEAGIGFAYRPVDNSKFNMIGKYTFLYDLTSSAQDILRADEKAHIISAEMSYDILQEWTIGSKLGYKHQGIREHRSYGDWLSSDIKLAALRVNYHLIKSWDAMAEYHWLNQENDGTNHGVLLGVYKHIGDNLKLGVGYNFSSFSDDLTKSNDYDAKGWFVNVIGKI